ncbi:MAG: TonB family protein [Verrucomicrobiaceae bacterium]|nr:TonB family protein [Verrucomicrobiaceae bacterium]
MSQAVTPPPTTLAWRIRSLLQEVPVGMCWLLGLSGSFLAVGITGMAAVDVPPFTLQSHYVEPKIEELPLWDAPMAELTTQEEDSSEPSTEEIPTEVPSELTELPEAPPLDLDLPEIAEALTEKDIFAIPTAPKIENALRPIEPEYKPRPRPSPTPRKSSSTASRSASSSTSKGGSPGGSAGGSSGGTRRISQSSPPYPSFAKAARMQGTVSLAITFAPSGYVSSVRVTGTSGYSALDQSTADYVRRNFRATPSSSSSTYSKRFTFRLR